jgi:signal transduction histidine kinase
MQSRPPLRIVTRTMFAFAAFALFCVGLTAAVLLEEAHDGMVEAIVERQRLLTENRAMMLHDNLALALGELVRLSHMAEIDLDDGDPAPEQRMLAQAFRQSPFFNRSVQLVGPHGLCHFDEPGRPSCVGRDMSRERWFIAAQGSIHPSSFFIAEPDGTGRVSLVVPIRREGGALAGFLRGEVDLQRDRLFSPALRGALPRGTRVALVTTGDAVVYRSSEVDFDLPAWRRAADALRTSTSGAHLEGDDGPPWLFSWAPVGEADLGLVFAFPWDALDASEERQLESLLWLSAGVGLLALLVGFAAASRLTRPVQTLAEQVRRAEAGLEILPPPPNPSDEVGELHRAFMGLLETLALREAELRADRDRISELAGTLERRVDERTSELRETQGALVQAERLAAVGRAGAVLSHELRNSLNAISVAMDTLSRPGERREGRRRDTQHLVRTEIARLRALSDDLLTFARDPVLRVRPVQVERLVRTVCLLVEDHASTLGVALEVELPERPLEARVDLERLQSALVNLLRNAIEAASLSEAKAVSLVASVEDGTLIFRIEDSGQGVSSEVRERLFQPFVSRRPGGVGLGLAIADRFVRAHGGRLELIAGRGRGACFEARLPIDGPPPTSGSDA